jgi:carbamate kinase
VALGGNAITRPGEEGTVAQDLANLARSLEGIATLLARGYELLLTHGNGPQVGNQMIRVELSRGAAPDLPLDVMGADIQGGLGYMIERVLRDKLRQRDLDLPVCCILSMVEVRRDDAALAQPTKFVGPVFGADQLEACRARGWEMKEDRGRGWRRVVPSPEPIGIVERRELATLLDAGAVVISGGGGGIPVWRAADGTLAGFEGVIDKDLASAVLALELGAPELFILTGVEQVMLDFATPAARPVARMTAAEARAHLAAGQFPAGSMGPKIEAACRFVERGGRRCLITGIDSLVDALDGRTGTWIDP